jgi:hypothetical protein
VIRGGRKLDGGDEQLPRDVICIRVEPMVRNWESSLGIPRRLWKASPTQLNKLHDLEEYSILHAAGYPLNLYEREAIGKLIAIVWV